ncbi:hypothetical protein [Mangrovitalea sediminis]|nr:hypothetical protein [Mangrovitalea sediminis]
MHGSIRTTLRQSQISAVVRRPLPAALIRQSPVAKLVLAKVLDE